MLCPVVARPTAARLLELSNLRAISSRYLPRIVSGRTICATSSGAFQPRRLPIFGQTDSFEIAKQDVSLDLLAKDSIFRQQVFIPKAQFLVNRTGDIGEHSFPIHLVKVERGRSVLSTLLHLLNSVSTDHFECFGPTGITFDRE